MSAAPAEVGVLLVSLGDADVALPMEHVREVLDHAVLTPVPLLPSALRGVIELRGEILPVLDLRSVLTGERVAGPGRLVVIAEASVGSIALLVEDTHGIVTARKTSRRPALQVERRFVDGAVSIGEQTLPLLDLVSITAPPDPGAS